MPPIARPLAALFAAAALLTSAALVETRPAAAATQLAQATPAPAPQPGTAPSKAQPKGAKVTPVDRVEARIKSLHARLKITAAQEPAWGAVAQTMRDNAHAVAALVAKRTQNLKTMTAVDDLNSYQEIAQAHADGLKTLAAAFQTLYASLSDAQKKNADVIFRGGSQKPKKS